MVVEHQPRALREVELVGEREGEEGRRDGGLGEAAEQQNATTRSPGLSAAAGRRVRTVPATSAPGTNGRSGLSWYWPRVCSTSGNDTPAALTSISTTSPPAPAGGSPRAPGRPPPAAPGARELADLNRFHGLTAPACSTIAAKSCGQHPSADRGPSPARASRAPGIASAVARPPDERDERVRRAVDHERGPAIAQLPPCGRRRQDRGELAADAGGSLPRSKLARPARGSTASSRGTRRADGARTRDHVLE